MLTKILAQLIPSHFLIQIKSISTITTQLWSRSHLISFAQKWWTLPLQHFFELQFCVISCSNVCRITISWYITPTITTYIFSNLGHTILNPNFPIFCHRLNPILSNVWVRPTSNTRNFNLNRQCFPYRNCQKRQQQTRLIQIQKQLIFHLALFLI